jgi:hypothetical protein
VFTASHAAWSSKERVNRDSWRAHGTAQTTTPWRRQLTLGANARITPREVALDGGFQPTPTNAALADLQPKTVFIAGRQEPSSRHTKRRLARYRTGTEGRVSHLKRRYGLDRSRLKGDDGEQIWTEWSILAYDADTLAIRAA